MTATTRQRWEAALARARARREAEAAPGFEQRQAAHANRLKAWRAYWHRCREAWRTGRHAPPFPDNLRDMTCGARTKAGTPCRQRALYGSGRCKWHGGLSTGPTTEAGKEQARINGRMGGRPKKAKP